MYRLYKPARDKNFYRGLFSYLTESVLHMTNFVKTNNTYDILYYHDLLDIPGYGNGNIFDICLIQNEEDFIKNKNLYQNIEELKYYLNYGCYDIDNYDNNLRIVSEEVVKAFFKPKKKLSELIDQRHREINFKTTIGVHRRATDIRQHHNIIPIENVFKNIEFNEFEYIFLMCDNQKDLGTFKKRYGNKLITYDEFTSKDTNLPFFKINNSVGYIHNHVKELMFGVFTLSKTKNFICTKSNVSSFCILSNSKLNYKTLN